MAPSEADDVTQLLAAVNSGDEEAANRLFPLIYDELRNVARRYLGRERAGHTLQATALVHEAYLKLVGQRDASWHGRAHFLAVAATAMRRILVNHAKAHRSAKRGGGRPKLALDEAAALFEDRAGDLLELDEALTRLARLAPDQARIVELRFFAGLSVEETAGLLGVSVRTAQYDWAMARAWLRGELADAEQGGDE